MLTAKFKKTIVTSLSQFEDQAEAWNLLWENSQAYEGISRAEGIALWMRHFKPAHPHQFRVILVHHCDELVGGIAFYLENKHGFRIATLPTNDWINCGELLIDSSCDQDEIIASIVDSLIESEIGLISLPQINLDADRWQKLLKELQNRRCPTHIGRQQQVGVIEVGNDWETYFASLSSNHRSAVRRSEKKIRKEGEVELLRIQNPAEEDLPELMQQAFEIEHRSWKARSGTSILASKGMDQYFHEEARIANSAQLLELWFLKLNGTPIAFEYCHRVKGVCMSYKIGYDESFKNFGPGRLLRKLQLEFLNNANDGTHLLDTKGTLCDAKAKWTTRSYETGTVLASTGSLLANLYVQSYSTAHKLRHNLLSRKR